MGLGSAHKDRQMQLARSVRVPTQCGHDNHVMRNAFTSQLFYMCDNTLCAQRHSARTMNPMQCNDINAQLQTEQTNVIYLPRQHRTYCQYDAHRPYEKRIALHTMSQSSTFGTHRMLIVTDR